MQESPRTFMDWLRESIVVKLAFIGFLSLVLLIPSVWVQSLITERLERQTEMMDSVSRDWSGSQLIQGPVLVIPYKKLTRFEDSAKKQVTRETIDNLYLLPEDLKIKGDVKSETLHRGIFDVAVYNSVINLSGYFVNAELSKLSITPEQLMLNKAKVTFSISDLKGLKTNPVVKVAGQTLVAEPTFNDGKLLDNGLQVAVNLANVNGQIPFSFNLDLKGSQELSFLHIGKTTDVTVTSDWTSPSFSGRYLPDDRRINDKGFKSHWRMLYYNRPFPQQWAANDSLLNKLSLHDDALFGVKLRLPVDQYQKTMRTSKYAILIILLTFISLFLTELIRKQHIHVFNYILIGAAMIIYYTLLLSFSEQMGYNLAYLIASIATIGLIATFTASLLKNKQAAGLFAFILALFYGFIFIIIQLEDLALLVGSVALFVIISTLMYFSRKINWDTH